jgi:O-antigen ligase
MMDTRAAQDRHGTAAWLGLVPAALLFLLLVGLNLIVDEAAYDVSQMPRLLALLVFLAVVVPMVVLRPGAGARLDTAVLRQPVVVASAAYLAACLVSLLSAVNVSAGLTDVFRTLAAFLVLCVCCLSLPWDTRWRERVLQVAVTATAVSAAIGWSEVIGKLGFGFHDRRAFEAVTGLMSNVNLFAGFLVLLLPLSLSSAVVLPGPWRMAGGLAATAALGLVVALQSRAAWLALGVAAASGAALLHGGGPRLGVPSWVRRAVQGCSSVAAVALVAAVLVTGSDSALGRWLDRLLVNRPHQAAGPGDGGRTLIWQAACRMIADHPLAGVGAGNFTIRLHEYQASDLDFSTLPTDNWVQPHNDYLWVFAEKGLPGIVAFAAVFTCALVALHRGWRQSPDRPGAWLALGGLMSLAAYLSLSLVDFPLDRISHQVLVAVLLAVAALLASAGRPAAAMPLPRWLVLPPVVAAIGLGIAYSVAALHQERGVMVARRAQRDGDWETMLAAARRAATPWKTLDPLVVPVSFFEGTALENLGRLPEAVGCLERARGENPASLPVLTNLGTLYATTGRFDEAVECLASAIDLYPDRIDLRHNLAICLIDAGRFAEAVAVLEDVPAEYRSEYMEAALTHARERLAVDPRPLPDAEQETEPVTVP